MGRKKKLIPKEVLQKEYWDDYLSIRSIAAKHNVAKDTINKLLALYQIQVRNPDYSATQSKRKTQAPQ